MGTRLNKYLAQSGLGSRRAVEELISSGRISINGKKVMRMATMVEPGDKVSLDGSPIHHSERHYYLILNKPRGYITTINDERSRLTVMDLIPEKYRRNGVFPVGRLDRDTSGLLIFTNDGELAYRLTKPQFHVVKEYRVELDKPLDEPDMERIRKGVYIHQLECKTRPAEIEYTDETGLHIRMALTEGKNRQIRYTFLNLGYKVRGLERTSYGTLTLHRLTKGGHRVMSESEVRALKKMAGLQG